MSKYGACIILQLCCPDGRAEGHKGAASQPVQLLEQAKVLAAVDHEPSPRVKDQEGPEEEADHDEGREGVAYYGSGEDDDGAEGPPLVVFLCQQQDPGVGQQAHWGQQAWGEGLEKTLGKPSLEKGMFC